MILSMQMMLEHRLPIVIFGTDTYRGGSEYIYFIERKHYENV